MTAPDPKNELVVVPPGGGDMLGNVEFLARSADTPRFNLSIITVAPRRHRPDHAPAGFDLRLGLRPSDR